VRKAEARRKNANGRKFGSRVLELVVVSIELKELVKVMELSTL
jgi:hypothetical protein